MTPPPIVLNQSRWKNFMNCQRLYAWGALERLSPVQRRSAPGIGTAVHAALAAFHAGQDTDGCVEVLKEVTEKVSGPTSAFEDASVAEAAQVGEDVFRAYVQHYGTQDKLWTPLNQEVEFLVEVQPGWAGQAFSVGGVAAKQLGEVELEHTNIWLRGKADNLSVVHGALYLVDYKTAGRMDPRDLLKYELDAQLSAYMYGLTKQLSEESAKTGGQPLRVEGAIIDLLVKTKLPQFARETFTRTAEEMEEFELEFLEYASRIRDQHARVAAGEDWKLVFPKNTEHCFRYGTCPFRDLCAHDTPARRAAYIQAEVDYVDTAQRELEEKWRAEG